MSSARARVLCAGVRTVVKVGSSSVSGENAGQIQMLVDSLAVLKSSGCEVILVSSGAIATGVPVMGLPARPSDLATQQAAAAVGQNILINRYQEALSAHGLVAGQVLLTPGDFEDSENRFNAKNALNRLLELGVVPIVNENDTVATREIRFGDNDRLAALVARLVDAKQLVLLSDVDALYTAPPHEPGAQKIEFVPYGDELDNVRIGEARSGWGTGGALTKVAAARLAASSGCEVVLTNTGIFPELVAGKTHGTWFAANPLKD